MVDNKENSEVLGNDAKTSPPSPVSPPVAASPVPTPTSPAPTPVSQPASGALKKGITLTPTTLVICVIVLVAAVVGGAFYISSLKKPPAYVETDVNAPQLDTSVLLDTSPEDFAKIQEDLQMQADNSRMAISYTPTPTFPNGTDKGLIELANSSRNLTGMVIQYVLEDGTVVLTSGLIPPGAMIKEKALDFDLDKGEYPATCLFTTYDEDGKKLGEIGVGITIIVQG